MARVQSFSHLLAKAAGVAGRHLEGLAPPLSEAKAHWKSRRIACRIRWDAVRRTTMGGGADAAPSRMMALRTVCAVPMSAPGCRLHELD